MLDPTVEALKKNWLIDPSWDLADTEGFEEHREELAEFQRAHEAQYADIDKQSEVLAERFNIHPDMAQLLLLMEARIRTLENALADAAEMDDSK